MSIFNKVKNAIHDCPLSTGARIFMMFVFLFFYFLLLADDKNPLSLCVLMVFVFLFFYFLTTNDKNLLSSCAFIGLTYILAS